MGSLNYFFETIGYSKQALHQMLDRRYWWNEEIEYLIPIIQQVRKDHPTLSCRALYYKINPARIGRDKFEKLCKDLGFAASVFHSRKRTTNSSGVIRFENLLDGLVLTAINQAWASDITYFEIKNCFYYITFILDCFSRLILGYSVSSRLTTEQTTLPALKQAILFRKKSGILPEGIILHSDGGGQYYDKVFIALTNQYNFKNSMCEYAYQNGKAERVNGIIKNNYLRFKTITTIKELCYYVDQSVLLYNEDRPHKSLKYVEPLKFEEMSLN
jgi:transposase InsO family protein